MEMLRSDAGRDDEQGKVVLLNSASGYWNAEFRNQRGEPDQSTLGSPLQWELFYMFWLLMWMSGPTEAMSVACLNPPQFLLKSSQKVWTLTFELRPVLNKIHWFYSLIVPGVEILTTLYLLTRLLWFFSGQFIGVDLHNPMTMWPRYINDRCSSSKSRVGLSAAEFASLLV